MDEDIVIREEWEGPATLNLKLHINAPKSTLHIKRVVREKHIKADLTLPYGRILYDYLKQEKNKNFSYSSDPFANLDFSSKENILKSFSILNTYNSPQLW